MFGLDFHVYSIFCLHRALYKIHWWNLFAHEKIKSERKSVVKKEKKEREKRKRKKKQAQRRKKAPFCQEEKKLVYESDWYWRSSSLANKEQRTKKSPSNQNLPCMMLKTRFSFVCKYQPWYKTLINDKRRINKFSNDILSTQRET